MRKKQVLRNKLGHKMGHGLAIVLRHQFTLWRNDSVSSELRIWILYSLFVHLLLWHFFLHHHCHVPIREVITSTSLWKALTPKNRCLSNEPSSLPAGDGTLNNLTPSCAQPATWSVVRINGKKCQNIFRMSTHLSGRRSQWDSLLNNPLSWEAWMFFSKKDRTHLSKNLFPMSNWWPPASLSK